MRIHIYFMDKTPSIDLPDYAAGVSTIGTLHSGSPTVKRIVDVRIAEDIITLLCDPLVPFVEPPAAEPEHTPVGDTGLVGVTEPTVSDEDEEPETLGNVSW